MLLIVLYKYILFQSFNPSSSSLPTTTQPQFPSNVESSLAGWDHQKSTAWNWKMNWYNCYTLKHRVRKAAVWKPKRKMFLKGTIYPTSHFQCFSLLRSIMQFVNRGKIWKREKGYEKWWVIMMMLNIVINSYPQLSFLLNHRK